MPDNLCSYAAVYICTAKTAAYFRSSQSKFWMCAAARCANLNIRDGQFTASQSIISHNLTCAFTCTSGVIKTELERVQGNAFFKMHQVSVVLIIYQKHSNLDSSMNCLGFNTQNQHHAALKSYFKFKQFFVLLLLSENICFTLYLETRVDSDEF